MEEVAQVEKVEMAAPMEDRSARVNEGEELEEVKAAAMEEAKVGVRATEVGGDGGGLGSGLGGLEGGAIGGGGDGGGGVGGGGNGCGLGGGGPTPTQRTLRMCVHDFLIHPPQLHLQ